ncbi:MAG TPA: hypothetical protein DIU20_06260 [Cryomorphaceae bacterium]|nr:hypothetical protein [Cryomorphaceae bacterium]
MTVKFNMPGFKSVAWVSDQAESVWSSRFKKINEALTETAVELVAGGLLPSLQITVEGALYFKLMHLAKEYKVSLESHLLGSKDIPGPVYYHVLLGETNSGLCPACRKSSQAMVGEQQKECLWQLSAELSEGKDPLIRETESPSVSGLLWRKLLSHTGPLRPCSLHCSSLSRIDKKIMDGLRMNGYVEEAEWRETIYSWPVEWNAVNGIAELRTPVVKLAYDTDAFTEKRCVRYMGTSYPDEGPFGRNFPYKRRRFLRVSDSKSFKAGLAHGN